jgi:hypothetical protein
MNLRENRPELQESSARVADYYRQPGVGGPELSHMTSTVLGSSVKSDAPAHGIQSGLRFLSLVVGGLGLLVTALLTEAQAGLTRAEQDYANAIYDYLIAIDRLQYAMGTTPTPLTAGSHPNR